MYPDWPESDADLVPLPRCDGPKLKPFDFQGPQRIEFLERIGEGLHSHVFKVQILGQIYALKLFRFCYNENWLSPDTYGSSPEDEREAMSVFYNYSEPFSCECRAFGRLQEAGHEELATKCHGYVLLDEEHEQAMMTQFSHLDLIFNGDIDYPGVHEEDNMRGRYIGKSGKEPPIRGLVKDFGFDFNVDREESIRAPLLRKILRDVTKLQQLGIIQIDVAPRQIVDDRLSDFSTAITIPHFFTTPELNPHLTPEMIAVMELETFRQSLNDYLDFDHMIFDWNIEFADQKGKMSVWAFPNRRGCQIKYNLRSRAGRGRAYTFVDPRKYDWKTCPAGAGTSKDETTKRRGSGRISKGSKHGKSQGVARRQLSARPPRWYFHCNSELAEDLGKPTGFTSLMDWHYERGFIFPRRDEHFEWSLRELALASPS